jgi:DNA repair and recombination protein RAD52
MPFSAAQVQALAAPLGDDLIHTRRKQGIELRYLEGFEAINQANAIFGYHAWSYQITKLEHLAGVWIATVLLTVTTPDGGSAGREDAGVGIPAVPRDSDAVSPDAQETAIKGAVTDALKRALRTFGNAFGNGLYDKPEPAGDQPQQQHGRQERRAPDVQNGETRACPSCEEPMVLRSGTTRDGRPYSAWFCAAKCGQKPIWLAEERAR